MDNIQRPYSIKSSSVKEDPSLPGININDTFHKSPEKEEASGYISGKYSGNKSSLDVMIETGGKISHKTIMGNISDDEINIDIKHTNDVHGNMPVVSNLINRDDFWVDAGDAWQGYSFHSIVSGGREEVDLMNQRDCDIAIPGNHFYDDIGYKGGEELIKRADFPIIGANVKGLAPYSVVDIGGTKIAFVGVRTPEKKDLMVDPSKVKELEVYDPVEAVKKSVKELKAKGLKNVIVLSHLGLQPDKYHPDILTDKDLAAKVPGIDIIIGGHSHTPTMTPVVVNGTTIVHAGIDSHEDVKTDNLYMGELSISINRKTGEIKSVNHKLIPVDRSNPIDDDVKNIKEKYLMEENVILSKKLGFSSFPLTHDIKTPGDSSLGNMITDAIRYETKADIAILDSNFFATARKNPPPSILPEGDVTMGDLIQTSLWMGKSLDASVETWNVRGETIKKILEDGVKKLLSQKNTEGLYQVSGIKMSYDPKKSEGNRIMDVFIGDKLLEEKKNYVLTTSYIQGNWNPLFSERDEKAVQDGRKIRHIVADYIKDKSFAMLDNEKRISCL